MSDFQSIEEVKKAEEANGAAAQAQKAQEAVKEEAKPKRKKKTQGRVRIYRVETVDRVDNLIPDSHPEFTDTAAAEKWLMANRQVGSYVIVKEVRRIRLRTAMVASTVVESF